MLETLAKAWKIPELRKKITFTILMIIVFRIGSNIPVPGMDRELLADVFKEGQGLFEIFDLFSGGAFQNFTIFALSITPYITASIILNLLTIAIPRLEALAREGTEGRKKIAQYTRYLTVALAFLQAIGLTFGLFRGAIVKSSGGFGGDALNIVVIILTLSAGTAFLMWLGEQINEHGVGNGISLLIFAGIVCRIPAAIGSALRTYSNHQINIISLILFCIFALVVIVGTIGVQQGQRRIPVQYAKRVVGRKMYGGQNTHIPLKVNQAGVIPVIFALSLLQFPLTITYFLKSESGFTHFVNKFLSPNGDPGVWIYSALNIVLILFFTFFYTAVTFNIAEVAENMRANGGFIPGIRPGKATVEYLSRVMSRVTFVGALFLAAIATLPYMINLVEPDLNIRFGGTALLIVVGVALDTMKQIENQMVMRNYKGFL
ncbi:MAG: preprotein translocase subunit SecY [Clostridiales Family XIII bacterium]|nr:preprotein translocase subunit SecY [Clostridiales Family XIII bacterium]